MLPFFSRQTRKKFWTSSKQIVMHGHSVRPSQAFAGQKLNFTGHLSNDQLLFASLNHGLQKMPDEHVVIIIVAQ